MPVYQMILKRESYSMVSVELSDEQARELAERGCVLSSPLRSALDNAVEIVDKRYDLDWRNEQPEIVYWIAGESTPFFISQDLLLSCYPSPAGDDIENNN